MTADRLEERGLRKRIIDIERDLSE